MWVELFFDTETTGIIKKEKRFIGGKRCDQFAPLSQQTAEIVQLAYVLVVDWKIMEQKNLYFKPMESISKEMTDIHGITNEMVADKPNINTFFSRFVELTNSASKIIGHNVIFDLEMFYLELLREFDWTEWQNKIKEWKKKSEKKIVDTMKSSIEFCKIPWPYGNKWPKLIELHRKLFDEDFEAHNALDDIIATRRCYEELISLSIIK